MIKPSDDYAGLLTQFHLLLEDIDHKGFQIRQVVNANQRLIEENNELKERVDTLEGQLEDMDEFIDRYQERCRNGG